MDNFENETIEDSPVTFDCVNQTDDQIEIIKEEFLRPTFSSAETIVLSTMYSVVSVSGVLGNGLVILAVLSVRRMQTVTNIFIANMSLANFIFAAILVPFMWLPHQSYWPYGNFLCKQVSGVAGVNLYCSAFTIVACAADRFYTVSTQNVSARLSKCYAGGVLFVIWLLSGFFTIPYWLYYEVSEVNLAIACRPDIIVMRTCDFRIPTNLGYLLSSVQLLFLLPVPLLALAIFNAKLSRFLKKHFNATESLRKRQTSIRHSRVTILLFSMTASYAVLWVPFLIFVAIGDISAEIFLQLDSSGKAFQRVQVALHLISSASVCINPLLYGFLNTNFRSAFTDIWYWIIKRERPLENPSELASNTVRLWRNGVNYGSGTSSASLKKQRFARLSCDPTDANLTVYPYSYAGEGDAYL